MPLNLEGLVPDDDSVRLLSHELEEFDYSLLEEADGLSKETIFLAGTKLEACANKYTFVWKKSVGKWEEKMFQKIQDAVQLLNQESIQDFSVDAETRTQDLQKICLFLEERCQTEGTVFVHERGKKKSRNQRYLELFRRYLELY